MRRMFIQRFGTAALVLAAAGAMAQSYPTKPVRLIVPFPAGGGIDFVARALAPKLSEYTGHSFVVDNRSGASGTIGTDAVAKAPADGYTLLATFSSHTQNASLYAKLSYDTVRDFAPVTQIATVANILVVNPAFPAKTLAEFLAQARARPGQINFASAGAGSSPHLAMEVLMEMTGC